MIDYEKLIKKHGGEKRCQRLINRCLKTLTTSGGYIYDNGYSVHYSVLEEAIRKTGEIK